MGQCNQWPTSKICTWPCAIRFNYQTELKFLTYSFFAVDKLFRNIYGNTDDLLLDLDVAGFINLHLVRSLMTSSAREPIQWRFQQRSFCNICDGVCCNNSWQLDTIQCCYKELHKSQTAPAAPAATGTFSLWQHSAIKVLIAVT